MSLAKLTNSVSYIRIYTSSKIIKINSLFNIDDRFFFNILLKGLYY